ncbi:hypothetical protein ACP275_04G095600 [Erythranthe tilingii]
MAKSKEKKKRKAPEEEEMGREVDMGEISDAIDVKIKVIDENPEQKTAPVIGYFPSGYDPLKNSGEPDSGIESNSSVKIYRSTTARNPKNPRMQVVVGSGGSEVNFVGTNYSGEATTPQICQYGLGVLDKETRILRIVPIAGNRIFKLVPRIASVEQSDKELPEEVTEEASKSDRAKQTTKMYSTKKNIKKDEKMDTLYTLRQTDEPGMEGDTDMKLKGVKVNTEAIESAPAGTNDRNIPPYNMEATVVEMAYPLDGIILNGEWDYLVDIFELAQAGHKVTPDAYPRFVCNRFHKLEEAEDDWNKRRIAGIFSYITHLIKFKDKHSMDGVSSSKNHKFPSIFLQKFSSMFDISSKKRIPEQKQNLLISYILVLCLFVDDFKSDPSDIAKDLRMDPLSLRTHYTYLGCKLAREKTVVMATLKVPLKFDIIKRKKRGR